MYSVVTSGAARVRGARRRGVRRVRGRMGRCIVAGGTVGRDVLRC